MINKLKPKSEFSRNVLTLMTGTTIAQAIPIAISPILTRIYTPEDFGIFALYIAIAMMLSTLATAKYEMAIMLPEKDEEAKNILVLSLIITTTISLISFISIFILNNKITQWLNNEEVSKWLYLLPISIFLFGTYQSYNYWSNRHKRYKILAQNKVLQSSSISMVSILAPFFVGGGGGLIISQIIGDIIATIRLFIVSLRKDPIIIKKIDFPKLIMLAKRYKDFPLYMLPGTSLNVGAKELAKILLGAYLGIKVLGFFTLTHRVITLPIGLFAGSFQQVLLQYGREEYIKYGHCEKIYNKVFLKLFIISSLLFIPVIPFLPMLFAFVFGEEWRISGEYAQILMPFYFIYFISAPLSQMFIIAEKQRLGLFWQIGYFLLSVGSIVLGSILFEDAEKTIVLFSIANFIAFSISIYLTYKLSKNKKEGIL